MVNPFSVKKGTVPEPHPVSMEFGEGEINFPEDEGSRRSMSYRGRKRSFGHSSMLSFVSISYP